MIGRRTQAAHQQMFTAVWRPLVRRRLYWPSSAKTTPARAYWTRLRFVVKVGGVCVGGEGATDPLKSTCSEDDTEGVREKPHDCVPATILCRVRTVTPSPIYPTVSRIPQWRCSLKKTGRFICNVVAHQFPGQPLPEPGLPSILEVERRFSTLHLNTFVLPEASVLYFEPEEDSALYRMLRFC